MLKEFWEDEYIATNIYRFMAKKVRGEKKELFLKISEMERGHANVYNSLAKRLFNVEFKPSIGLKIKVFFYKLLALIMPVIFMISYLELGERIAALEYSKLLEKLKDYPEAYEAIKRIMEDEVGHEAELEKLIMGEKAKIARIKDAIYGMTDSLVEILALVIGLASVIANPLTVGLAGLISSIGGTFSMTSGAYLSAKSKNDIYTGEVNEIKMKAAVLPESLKADLSEILKDKGVKEKLVEEMVEELSKNKDAMVNLTISLGVEETPENPKEVAITTGVYYILGALPAILPFFIGYFFGLDTITIAIIAIAISAIISFVVGIFTAVLSGISIKRKAFENVLIIIGATMATYTIGTLAKMWLGIEV